ncbi:MAG: Iron-sulfur cluster carrier protein [Acidimicrobiales bacterium]|nr:Iron-sulfur cluster carrier protein [Acidimicrobiales bacterium]
MPTPRPTPPDTGEVYELLRGVIDPELGSDIVDLGMVRGVESAADGTVSIKIALTTARCPLRGQIQKDVTTRVGSLPGVGSVEIAWAELTAEEKARTMGNARLRAAESAPPTAIPPTAKVLMIASGKGGVGKSAVTVNLAAELAQRGLEVGIIDADIWGFSVPRMLGIEGRLQAVESGEKKIAPKTKRVGRGEIHVVSMGLLVEQEESALMWRGLILSRAVQHFLEDVCWPTDLDYVLIDMPPGTGDVQMGLARMLPRADMIVVTTPAVSAQKVAVRVVNMGRRSHLRVAGVIENMSVFVSEEGKEYALFGRGGGQALAADAGVPLLGCIPIDPSVAEGSDEGRPAVLQPGPAAREIRKIVEQIVEEIVPPVEMQSCSARILEAAIANLDAVGTGPATG